ncbi:MAG: hypothetical protein DMD59_00455 [Gemmatimonadetes bacterium]|nr:MAG: hypothetical protein DMD59_00455 [Gemmatimonadota bacterium]
MIAILHDMIGPLLRRSRRPWGLAASLAGAGTLLAACHLLDVSNPDIVPPEGLNSAAALPTIRAGAIGDLHIAYTGSGAQGSGGTTEGVILLGGMLSDELINTETFPDRILADARRPQRESVTLTNVFRNVHRARRAAEAAAAKFRQYSPDTTLDAGLAEMLSLAGYAYVFLAENYCSGVPVSTVNADGSFTYGDPLTTAEVLDTALDRFRQALGAALALDTVKALATGGPSLLNSVRANRTNMTALARMGIGRVLLDSGNAAAADTAVTAVATSFAYLIQHDLNTTRQNNGVFNGIRKFKRYGVEAALRRKDTTTYLTTLNALRATPPSYVLSGTAALTAITPALTSPADSNAAVTQLFTERGRWLWLTGHRLGDLRRLERQYARPDSLVFPNGGYFKSGLQYGSATSYPIPLDEENNPKAAACLSTAP